MLPKAARIREDREFKTVFARGRSYRGDLIVMYVLPRRTNAVRFGFTTVKKIGNSVERNRLRRLLRESARRFLPLISSGVDIVVLARTRAAGATFAQIDTELARLMDKAGFLKKEEGQAGT